MNTYEQTGIKSFTDLVAWQQSHLLVLDIYKVSHSFPDSEKFALTSQIHRAAISITSNIAEGFARNSIKEKTQFYAISLGSLAETQSQLLLAKDLNYLSPEDFKKISEKSIVVSKLINGLIKGLIKIQPKSLNS